MKLSDRVAVEVGTQIVRGEVPAGARLPTESELGETYGVSRSVIRDAIRTLSTRGLVDVRQGHGIVVARPTDSAFAEALIVLLMRSSLTIGHVLDARVAIETELVPLAVEHGTEADWQRLRAALKRYGDAVQRNDWPAAQAAHAEFHYALLESIHLPALQVLLRPMQQIILLSSVPPSVEFDDLSSVWTQEDVDTHYPIVDALERRDADAVREAMAIQFQVARRNRALSGHSRTLFRDATAAQQVLAEMLTRRSGLAGKPESTGP